MLSKLDEIIELTLISIKDLFFEKDLFLEYLYNKDEEKLRFNIYEKLKKECDIKSLDEIYLLLKKLHPLILNNEIDKKDLNKYYLDIITSISKYFYSIRDGKIVYKYWINSYDELFGPCNESDKIEIFRRINRKICMDIFTVNHIIENNNNNADMLALNNNYSNIELADLQLDDILFKGVSENHIHGSAALSFSLSWQILMFNNFSKNDFHYLKIIHSNNELFKNNSYIYLKLAELIRNYIIIFMKNIEEDNEYAINEITNKKPKKLNKYISVDLEKDIVNLFIKIDNEELKQEDEKFILNYLEKINKDIGVYKENDIDDFLYKLFNIEEVNTYSENIFLFKVLDYIKNKYKQKGNRDFILNLFFKYIRIKNQFYLNLVESNNIIGLDNFKLFFDNGTKTPDFLKLSAKKYYKIIIKSLFQDRYLKNVEIRLSFKSNQEELRKSIKFFLEAYKEVIDENYIYEGKIIQDFPRMGLIFHLIKKDDYNKKDKCIYNYFNLEDTENLSYEKLIEEYNRNVENLLEIRNKTPELSYFILGIDTANLENSTPTEVFATVYDNARDSTKDNIVNLDFNGNPISVRSLRFTYHAGEDFRHILSGIRRIDEVVKYCKFHSGDRIGHGIALGIDVEKWCKKNSIVVIPRQEHLNNLLWIWGIYSSSYDYNPKISIYLEREIYKLSKDIYINNVGITTPMLYENYEMSFKSFNDIYDKEYIKNIFKDKIGTNFLKDNILCVKSTENVKVWDIKKLYYSKHCKCYLERMSEPIFVSIKDIDKEIIKDIQKIIINKIAMTGIVVEVNPSSNMGIGEFHDLFEYYAFNINGLKEEKNKNIMLTINTDDPMIFNTTLSNEYAYIYYALIKKGYSKESVLNWIDKVRQCSIDTNFIDKSLSNEKYYEYLNNILEVL